MERTVKVTLRQFDSVPAPLRPKSGDNVCTGEAAVNVGRLYHHYYFDSYGIAPPDPDPVRFEYVNFLSPGADFRFQGDGPAVNPGKRRSISTDLGQAFCRWFLYENVGITYFAHMSKVLGKETHPAFDGLRLKRCAEGDTPDYLCARKVDRPFLGEAKGRFDSISDGNLLEWESQFKRVEAFASDGKTKRSLKGYIVGTRYATEETPRVWTTIHAQDSKTEGSELTEEEARALARGAVAYHYGRICSKLRMELLAAALTNGFALPPELATPMRVWTCIVPPLNGRKFVGGFFARPGQLHLVELGKGKPGVVYQEESNLAVPTVAFFGLDLDIARVVATAARGDWLGLQRIPRLEDAPSGSEMNFLRDGTVSAPLSYFVRDPDFVVL